MTVIFNSDSISYTFELSVIGDLTGEGNVNTRDLSVMAKYLTDQADFNGVYYLSADLSDDGVVDADDVHLFMEEVLGIPKKEDPAVTTTAIETTAIPRSSDHFWVSASFM